MATLLASSSADARLVQSALSRGTRPPEEDEKLRNAIHQLTVSTTVGNDAFTRSLDDDEGIMMRYLRTCLATGMRSSTTTTTGGGEASATALTSKKKPLPRYAGGVPRTPTLFVPDLAKRVWQMGEGLDLGLRAQCLGSFVALLRLILKKIKDEHVEEVLDDLPVHVRVFLKMTPMEASVDLDKLIR